MLSQPIPFVNAQAATPRRPHQKLFVKLTVSEHTPFAPAHSPSNIQNLLLITKVCWPDPSWPPARFPLANITLHNLLLIATIIHDLVSIVTGWHQPPNPPWNPNKLLTDRKKMYPKIIEKHLFSHMQWISWFFWIDMKSFRIFSQSWNSRFRDFLTL